MLIFKKSRMSFYFFPPRDPEYVNEVFLFFQLEKMWKWLCASKHSENYSGFFDPCPLLYHRHCPLRPTSIALNRFFLRLYYFPWNFMRLSLILEKFTTIIIANSLKIMILRENWSYFLKIKVKRINMHEKYHSRIQTIKDDWSG